MSSIDDDGLFFQTTELVGCLEQNSEEVYHLSLKNTIADGGIETLKPSLKLLANLQVIKGTVGGGVFRKFENFFVSTIC